jgi:hypothetical protein
MISRYGAQVEWGKTSKRNVAFWSDENHQIPLDPHRETDARIGVYRGIHESVIVESIFLDNRLIGDRYRHLLETKLQLYLNPMVLASHLRLYFLHDRKPQHFSCTVHQFYSGRFIGPWETVECPPRSPDLIPLDLLLWGRLKSVVYDNGPRCIATPRTTSVTRARPLPQRQCDACALLSSVVSTRESNRIDTSFNSLGEGTLRKPATATQPQFPRILISLSWTHVTQADKNSRKLRLPVSLVCPRPYCSECTDFYVPHACVPYGLSAFCHSWPHCVVASMRIH